MLPALPVMDHTGGYKESQYHPILGAEICARIEAGETVRQVAAEPSLPSYATIFRWRKMHPDFARAYDAARLRAAEARLERAEVERRSKTYWRIHKARTDGRPVRDWVSGRRSTYDRAWAQAWCDRIAGGEAGYRVSAEPGMPSAKQVYGWLKRVPEFREMYVEARARQRRRLMLAVHETIDRVGELGFRHADRRVAWLEGRMGRLAPKVWKRVPPERDWPEPPGGGMRAAKGGVGDR